MGYIITFISGAIVGVVLMCIVQVKQKDHQDDEEQMKYLKEWTDKHGNLGGIEKWFEEDE